MECSIIHKTPPEDGYKLCFYFRLFLGLNCENLTDLKVQCDGVIIDLPQNLLETRSEKFRQLIKGVNGKEVLELSENTLFNGFHDMLKYYGYATLKLSSENAIALYLDSLYLEDVDLAMKCKLYSLLIFNVFSYIKENVDVDIINDFLDYKENFPKSVIDEIEPFIIEFIQTNTMYVLSDSIIILFLI